MRDTLLTSNRRVRTLLHAVWVELRRFSILRWLLLLMLVLIAIGADATGTAIIASTGIANSTGSLLNVDNLVPFTSIARRHSPPMQGGTGTNRYHIYSSGTSYPHILQHEESKTFAFLPVEAEGRAPSHYSGVALFGKFGTVCERVPGKFDLHYVENRGLNFNGTLDLKDWKYPEKPPPSVDMWTSALTWSPYPMESNFMDNFATVVTLPWNNVDPTTNTLKSIKDGNTPIHLFGVVRIFAKNLQCPGCTFYYEQPESYNKTYSNGTAFNENEKKVPWEFQICRTEVPHRIGTIHAEFIPRETLPVTQCNATKTQFCPEKLRYHPVNLTTKTWKDEDERRYLNATASTKNTAWEALQGFLNDKLDARAEIQRVNYCHMCTDGLLASKYYAQLVADAETSEELQDALSGSFMHAIASTYRAQLPYFEGLGKAEWAVPREVVLVVNQKWLWIGVWYTWGLAVIALVVRAAMLRVVGVDRAGSTLAVAALVDDPNGPLKPLVERGYMNRQVDFEVRMREEKEVWEKKIKLGELPDGRYGIIRADGGEGVSRRQSRGLEAEGHREGEMQENMERGSWVKGPGGNRYFAPGDLSGESSRVSVDAATVGGTGYERVRRRSQDNLQVGAEERLSRG